MLSVKLRISGGKDGEGVRCWVNCLKLQNVDLSIDRCYQSCPYKSRDS